MPLRKVPERVDVNKLKTEIPIADVIGSVVSLTRSGGLLKGLCPFHQEKNPSFTVYPDSFFCFSCRESGDVLNFVQKFYKLDFPQALEWLAQRQGTFEPTPVVRHGHSNSVAVIPDIVTYYHSMLQDEHRSYFHNRLFTDITIDRELWGFDGKRYAIPVWGGRPQESECLGIRLRKREGDEGPKYIGIRGSNDSALYNTWSINNERGAFVFFGEFDAQLACQDGYPAVSPVNGCGSWDSLWNGLFIEKEGIIIIPDVGEERFAHKLADTLGASRCRVLSLAHGWPGTDYNEGRMNGATPKDLLNLLVTQYSHLTVEFDF